MIVGSYGSGKTEISVNLAIRLAQDGHTVRLADLDIVNPYFRSREARDLMERHGVRVVVPPGAQAFADLPIILPEIRGMLQPGGDQVSIFDIGGDDVGARALASFRTSVEEGAYELLQVINSRRPFTDTVEACLAMRHAIETASRFRVTGLIANSHLVDETTPDVIVEGWDLARRVSEASGLPVRFVAALERFASSPQLAAIDVPLLRMERHMLPPWRTPRGLDADAPGESDRLPAARPVPLGKPTPERFDTN